MKSTATILRPFAPFPSARENLLRLGRAATSVARGPRPRLLQPRRAAWRCSVVCAAIAMCLGGLGPFATASASNAAAAPAPPSTAEIREIVALLVDDNMDVRRAASDKLVAIGDPALVVLEEEIRAGRMRPNGQVKLALLALRARRLDRQWNERLATMTAKPWRQTFVRVVDGDAAGELEYRLERAPERKPEKNDVEPRNTSRAAARPLSLEVAERRGEGRGATTATLAVDRTFSPAKVDSTGPRPDHDAHGTISDRRLVGTFGGAAIDRPAPPPLMLDLALPLAALAMPREVGAELVCTVLRADELTFSPTAELRCVRRDERTVDGKSCAVFVYELSGDGPVRRVEIADGDRVLLAELRPGLAIRRRSS